MTTIEVKEMAKSYGKELTEAEIVEFFKSHNGRPSIVELHKFCGGKWGL